MSRYFGLGLRERVYYAWWVQDTMKRAAEELMLLALPPTAKTEVPDQEPLIVEAGTESCSNTATS